MDIERIFIENHWSKVDDENLTWTRSRKVEGEFLWTEEVSIRPLIRTTYLQKLFKSELNEMAEILRENRHVVGQLVAGLVPMHFGGGLTKLALGYQAQKMADSVSGLLSDGVEKDKLLMVAAEIKRDLSEIASRDTAREAKKDVATLKALMLDKSP